MQKKSYKIKIAEQVKLFSTILCKIMHTHKNAQKDELKMHKTELVNGYLTSHLVILLLIFDNFQASPSLKHLTSVFLQSSLFCINGCLFKATRKPRIFIAKVLLTPITMADLLQEVNFLRG
jgi:hypothetical protein